MPPHGAFPDYGTSLDLHCINDPSPILLRYKFCELSRHTQDLLAGNGIRIDWAGTNANHQVLKLLIARGRGSQVFHRTETKCSCPFKFLLRYGPYVVLRGIIALTVQILPSNEFGFVPNPGVSPQFLSDLHILPLGRICAETLRSVNW